MKSVVRLVRLVPADVAFHDGEVGRFERLTIRGDGAESVATWTEAPAGTPPATTP